jgi:aldehyde dehydrogenase (NAD+)
MDKQKVVHGSTGKGKALEPTVLFPVSWDDAVMQDEIFGPVLPVLEYDDFDALLHTIRRRPKPLSFYLFSMNAKRQQQVMRQTSSGALVINDVIEYMVNKHLPFGGVGESGMGAYHGEHSFKVFSHYRSIVRKSKWYTLPLRYQPYNKKFLKVLKAVLR